MSENSMQIPCDINTCKGLSRSQRPVAVKTCVDLKKKKKSCNADDKPIGDADKDAGPVRPSQVERDAKQAALAAERSQAEKDAQELEDAKRQAERDAKELEDARRQAEIDAKQAVLALERSQGDKDAQALEDAKRQAERDAKDAEDARRQAEKDAKDLEDAKRQAERDAKQAALAAERSQADRDAKELERKRLAERDAKPRKESRARHVDYGDQMNEEKDEGKPLVLALLDIFKHKYARKLAKALLLFLLGLKISRECSFMLIPMRDYSPWRQREFQFLC